MDLALSNVINISVSQAPAALGPFNVNNLALFTDDTPNASFPQSGYQIYKTASQVAADFGSTSKTFQMATAVFAQSPNILAGNGYLVIWTLLANLAGVTEIQTVSFSSLPTSGNFTLSYGGVPTAAIPFSANAAAVQTALQAVAGLSTVTVTGSFAAGFVVTMTGVSGDAPAMTVATDTLQDASQLNVSVTDAVTTHGVVASSTELLLAAITRTQSIVSYCGVIKANAYVANEMMNASNYVQTQDLILFVASASSADVAVTTGIFWQIQNAGNSKTRAVLYLKDTYASANLAAAAYAGRALSTDFSGSNTTQTVHLKNLATIQVDPNMTQGIFNSAQIAGADVYASFKGVAKIYSSGANRFFDSVYNQMWLTTALAVAGFNALATTSTKVPQTEIGISVIKTAYRLVAEQAKTNQYVAPGAWTGDTFGNQQDFLRNIAERGYYIWSSPIATQLPVDRSARKAPLVQMAFKEAGAVHTGNVLVNINA